MVHRRLAALALGMLSAAAAPLTVISYDGQNGQGQASGGTFNYWDLSYSGTGSTNVDGALLTGGTGDLTDGLIALGSWRNVENAAGTGPYVGWREDFTPNPLLTFRFAGPVTLTRIVLYLDDSDGDGGVRVPASIDIGPSGGPLTNFAILDPPGPAPAAFVFDGLSLTAAAVDIRLNHLDDWVFLSEAAFDGTAVPEPPLGGALALALVLLARRRLLG